MKRVVSVSLGSSRRDHRWETEFLGEHVVVERIGTDGDMRRAIQLVRELDGKVDAFGMGGIDLYIRAGNRRWAFKDARRIAEAARVTPMVDGGGLKDTLERWVIEYLTREVGWRLAGRRTLMVLAVDRYGMAEALVEAGADAVFGDLIFGLGVPIPLRSLRWLKVLAFVLAPIITRLPFQLFYPTGKKQEEIVPKHGRFYRWAEVIVGDFHAIHRHMPDDLTGKVIITNTVTSSDVEELRRRGVAVLCTTTPDLGGRSFGTNVLEAALVAVSGRRPEELTRDDYLRLIQEAKLRPRIEVLNRQTAWAAAPGLPGVQGAQAKA
ncbi:MAG: quinate 5-dehydrogenase [Bacillota bacterium]